jgi:hypothetical protein
VSYDLVINRLGAVAGGPVLAAGAAIADQVELVATFREQTERLSKLTEFKVANKAVFSVACDARDAGTKMHEMELHPDDPIYPNKPDIFGIPLERNDGEAEGSDQKAPKFESLVGLLPYRKVRVTIDGVEWMIRTRASMTSCSLQTGPRQTKLWWNVEGIPLAEEPLDETRAASFARLAESMAETGMKPLRVAYVVSLKQATGKPATYEPAKKGIQISLTDNDDRPVAELLDALYFRRAALDVIEDKGRKEFEPAREGLSELRRFIDDATKSELHVGAETLEVNDTVPNVKGILCRENDTPIHTTIIAGFARRAGGSGGYATGPEPWDSGGRRERYVRSFSPARRLSARLANLEARQIEERLGLN